MILYELRDIALDLEPREPKATYERIHLQMAHEEG